MKSLPKTETLWATANTPGGIFYTTSDRTRMKYSLWRKDKDGVTKIKTAQTPSMFEEILEPYWSAGTKKGRG